jgi:hypothetical protein
MSVSSSWTYSHLQATLRRPPPTSCTTVERAQAAFRDDSHACSRNRVVWLAALASDEDGAVDLGSTLRPRAKAAITRIVLGKGTTDRGRST